MAFLTLPTLPRHLRNWAACAARLISLFALLLLSSVAPLSATAAQVGPLNLGTGALQTSSAGIGLVRLADGRLVSKDIGRIVARGEIVVAVLGSDAPPFFQAVNGELTGTDIDMAREIGRELGVNVRFDRSAKSFNQVVEIVARGEADLGISKLSRTLARSQSVRFSAPYLSLEHALLINRLEFAKVARDQSVTSVLRNFKGSIGVIANSSFAGFAARNFPQARLVSYASWDEVVKAVQRGDVVAAYRDEFEVKRILKLNPTASLTLRSVTFKDLVDSLSVAVGIQDTVLLDFVNQYLAQRPEKMTVDTVLATIKPN